jgi:hypothetical protein
MYGPIDYVIVGFKGAAFDGSIVDELSKAVKNGIIRVVDLIFIVKDPKGNVIGGEYADQSNDLKEKFGDLKYDYDNAMPLFTESDIGKAGEMMENNTAAGVLVIEHLWAKGLKGAIQKAGGSLIADGRIHSDTVDAAVEEIENEDIPQEGDLHYAR